MESAALKENIAQAPINVLLVGNNPTELSSVYHSLKNVKGRKYIAEIAFDLKNIFSKIVKTNPTCILIDDNLDNVHIKKLIRSLMNSHKTKNIPITILKNSNFKGIILDGVQDYILKDNFSADAFYKSLINSRRMKRTQLYLHRLYRKNTSKVSQLLEGLKGQL